MRCPPNCAGNALKLYVSPGRWDGCPLICPHAGREKGTAVTLNPGRGCPARAWARGPLPFWGDHFDRLPRAREGERLPPAVSFEGGPACVTLTLLVT